MLLHECNEYHFIYTLGTENDALEKKVFPLKHGYVEYLCLNSRSVCLSDDDDDDDDEDDDYDDYDDVAAPSIGAKEISAAIGGRRSSNDEWLLVTVACFTVDHVLHGPGTGIASDKLQLSPVIYIDSKR